jgi:hypothetical protein
VRQYRPRSRAGPADLQFAAETCARGNDDLVGRQVCFSRDHEQIHDPAGNKREAALNRALNFGGAGNQE